MGGGASSSAKWKYNPAVVTVTAAVSAPRESDEIVTITKVIEWPRLECAIKVTDVYYNFNSWDFDIWLVEPDSLPQLCSLILVQHTLPTKFDINFGKWCCLCNRVKMNMLTPLNPYHNMTHLTDVMQTCAVFMGEMGGASVVNDTDVLALFLAALVHDIGHPGLNNAYQIHAETPLALRYNDISVLEHHHCALAFEVFQDAQSNIFQDIPSGLRKAVRKSIINLVLSTDMMSHFALLDELKNCVTQHFNLSRKEDTVVLLEKDRMIILRSILHAADISNPAKNWKISKQWSDLVVQEFFAQGDKEKKELLPVSMNMDRTTSFQDEISLNFNDFMVAPFFFTLLKVLPKLEKAVRHLESNRNRWNSIMQSRISDSVMLRDSEKTINMNKWSAKEADFVSKVKLALDFAEKKLRSEELHVMEYEQFN